MDPNRQRATYVAVRDGRVFAVDRADQWGHLGHDAKPAYAGSYDRRIMVTVHDFGAVNISATQLASASDDMLELFNGCVCCTMGADLCMAVGDILDCCRASRLYRVDSTAAGTKCIAWGRPTASSQRRQSANVVLSGSEFSVALTQQYWT